MRTWLEITSIQNDHGGDGWQFGVCLWSPMTNAGGARKYEVMREPEPGDEIIHILRHVNGDNTLRLQGISTVADHVTIHDTEPPSAGQWAGRSHYYRIPVSDFRNVTKRIPFSDIIRSFRDRISRELEQKPKNYPFVFYANKSQIRVGQGVYLAECTDLIKEAIYELIEEEVRPALEDSQVHIDLQVRHDFQEGKQRQREAKFFVRNPGLVRAAKEIYGYVCACCGFDFEQVYGDIGKHYIECHHLNPLSERPIDQHAEDSLTSIEDVRMLCSNCHRMAHRRRPPYTIEELQGIMNGGR